jgi:hypothetical protein
MIETSMHFLQRSDLYSTVKPYSLRFEPPDGFERSNIKLERREDLKVEDARPEIKDYSLDKQGFKIVNMKSKMAYEDFQDDANIVRVYLSEVADTLRDLLGAAHVQIFEHTVRRRHPEFPVATGEPYTWNQPTSMAHVGTKLKAIVIHPAVADAEQTRQQLGLQIWSVDSMATRRLRSFCKVEFNV